MGRLFAPYVRGTLAFLLAFVLVITSFQSANANEVHIVEPGETLSQIASRYGTTVANLRRLNNLPNINFVWYGQRLLIDSGGAPTNVAQGVGSLGTYKVRPGDSLSAVARSHGLSVTKLAQLNGISPLRWLYNGQVLHVPGSTAPVQAAPAAAPVSQVGAGNQIVEGSTQYTVRPGDSITRLAKRHGISAARLMSMNGLTSARWLYVGQSLLLPSAPAPAPAPAPQPALPVPALRPAPLEAVIQPVRSGTTVHTIQDGDSFDSLAERYGVSPPAIIRLNGLTNGSVLDVGQTLSIPSEDALELIENLPNRLVPAQYPTTTERWVEVDLGEQLAVAYEGMNPVKAFVISSGVGNTPTVTGTFRIWAKIAKQDMSGGSRAAGDYYHLKDVPDVQFFHRGYGFHGTYWHNNFGTPMSRGCVNMTKEDAKWLFDWTSPAVFGDDYLFSTNANPGTLVMIHQ